MINLTKKPIYAIMTVERFIKEEGTKNTWVIDRVKTHVDAEIVEQTRVMYNNTFADIALFESLGGVEKVMGDKLISVSPDGMNKTVRTFKLTRSLGA